jgi:hypothetical protein
MNHLEVIQAIREIVDQYEPELGPELLYEALLAEAQGWQTAYDELVDGWRIVAEAAADLVFAPDWAGLL